MYSILVLGSDWFSTSVIRTIRQANYKQHNIKSITAATKGMNLRNSGTIDIAGKRV